MLFIAGAAMIVALLIPTAKLYMEYLCTPCPRLNPLVFVLVNGIDIREQG